MLGVLAGDATPLTEAVSGDVAGAVVAGGEKEVWKDASSLTPMNCIMFGCWPPIPMSLRRMYASLRPNVCDSLLGLRRLAAQSLGVGNWGVVNVALYTWAWRPTPKRFLRVGRSTKLMSWGGMSIGHEGSGRVGGTVGPRCAGGEEKELGEIAREMLLKGSWMSDGD